MTSVWEIWSHDGIRACMYCGHRALYQWHRDGYPVQLFCCGACAHALGWSEIEVDWEDVHERDEMCLEFEERWETPLGSYCEADIRNAKWLN